MLVSKLFGKTLRDKPAEAELASHRLMLKAGMIYQAASGIYSYLPLAWRSIRKIERIIREEMDAAGGQELRMPALQPKELWEQSGRDSEYGSDMFRLDDRRGRMLVLAPTHEELLTSMLKSNVRSYRDLPLLIYQIQTKFRDEPRPRGGLLRVREFDMKDAYSFDVDQKGLNLNYQSMVQAYKTIFDRCGIPTIMVEADSGAIGGKDSQEFVMLSEAGEDTVFLCNNCNYAANAEKATFAKLGEDNPKLRKLEEIHTPGIKTIEELAKFLDISTSETLKAVFYMIDGEIVIVTIRGDLEVNEVKLRNEMKASELRLATPNEVQQANLVSGSASPVGLERIKTVADDSIQLGSNFVVGANREDYHLRNANPGRDFQVNVISDISLAKTGYLCPHCQSPLQDRRGIEVGHVFKLGTKYSTDMEAYVTDKTGEHHPVIMGCYGIGVGRLLAATIEQNHDENGIVFPRNIAPYQVWITALSVEQDEISQTAKDLYKDLSNRHIEVIYDDRQESAGIKFNDADLVGLPIQVVVSPRNLAVNTVEIRHRASKDVEIVPLEQAIDRISELLTA